MGSLDWQAHDKGLGEDLVWLKPHRKHKGHQLLTSILLAFWVDDRLCTPSSEGTIVCFNIPGYDSAYR